jgi:MFS transporter, FHS family, glucose/mannose:H+ symporter
VTADLDEPRRLSPIALIGYASFLLIGWSSLLVPSLIRSVEDSFRQTDAGIGAFYLVFAISYAAGSFAGGLIIERLGRRVVLSAAGVLLGIGLAGISLASDWVVFMLAGIPAGIGAGGLDGGVNGLFLALYRRTRSGALSLLHLFFSLGALIAPLAIGQLVEAGGRWQVIVLATAAAAWAIAILLGLQRLPSGLHARVPQTAGEPTRGRARRSWLPFVALAAAICFYVASEIGVSSWLVRFLAAAPLTVATLALSLFWGGLTLGRLVSAAVADRFDAVLFATITTVFASAALVGAVASPALPLAVVLFAVAGFGFGPTYPMIMSIGGTIYPERLAAVSGGLGAAAVIGSVVYPPLMGFVSVEMGLGVGMLGTGLLGFACAAALVTATTAARRASKAEPTARTRARAR